MNHTAINKDAKNSGDKNDSGDKKNPRKRKRSENLDEKAESPAKRPRIAPRVAEFVPNSKGGESILFGNCTFQKDKPMTKTRYSDSELENPRKNENLNFYTYGILLHFQGLAGNHE